MAEDALVRFMYWAVAILLGLLIGLWLYWWSEKTSREQYRGTGAEGAAAARPRATAGLAPAIAHELKVLPGSAQQREQAAQAVSRLVGSLIDEQVTSAKQALQARHEQVVEETRRNETVLQRKYQDALVEKKQTSAVLESIAEGLVVVNTKGDVVMMNPAAERLLGVKQSDRLGKPLLEHLKDEQLVSLVQQTTEGQREIVLSAKQESTKRVLRASNAMIADENGSTVGMVAVLSDVTKQREVEELKSEFVSKVSHELRTPLVAMQHSLAVVTDKIVGPLTEEQDKFLGITARNLERLNALISDLLDLSKLEARKMELRLERGPVGPVIQTVCESLTAWAQAKVITIVRRVPEGLPPVLLDQARITQVLTNLVGNAIKFTPKQGRITVEVKTAEGGAALEIGVADTGVGIAKADLPKLFNKFQQVGERGASDISGTGLGLVISKEIVELHRGRIWAESGAQQGARFVFTLPVAKG